MQSTITLAVTGASGLPYGMRLLQCLLEAGNDVLLIFSEAAREVARLEMGWTLPADLVETRDMLVRELALPATGLTVLSPRDWFSAPASGSGAPSRMVICPCSMGTVAAIAHGTSDNLIERAADVIIKERGQLILVPREMPYSTLHLENMLALSRLGVTIMPASPAFYHRPNDLQDIINFVVARILDHFGVPQQLVSRWGSGTANGSL